MTASAYITKVKFNPIHALTSARYVLAGVRVYDITEGWKWVTSVIDSGSLGNTSRVLDGSISTYANNPGWADDNYPIFGCPVNESTHVSVYHGMYSVSGYSLEIELNNSGVFVEIVPYDSQGPSLSWNSYSIAAALVPPTVTTSACTNVENDQAQGNGEITSIGTGLVTAHGMVYSPTIETPTLENSFHTDEGATGVGVFSSIMEYLQPGRKYYVRAYASNVWGTGYGDVVELYLDPGGTFKMAFGQSIFTESPDWTDLTADLRGINIKRGRNHDLDKIEAGIATVELLNLNGNYWRDNAAGDYYPDVKPLTLAQISCTWEGSNYVQFYGVVESFQHGWIDNRGAKLPVVTITCVDLFKSFARMKVYPLPGTVGAYTNVVSMAENANSGQKDVVITSLVDDADEGCDISLLHVGQAVTIGDTGASEINVIAAIDEDSYTLTMENNLANNYTTGNDGYVKKFPVALTGRRVKDILAELGWPSALTDIDDGQRTITEFVPDSDGELALPHLMAVAETEEGLFFIARTGYATFQDAIYRLSTSVEATFSDDGNDEKYVIGAPEDDDSLIYNEAQVVGDGITTQIYRDLTAQALQGIRVFTRSGSLLSLNSDAFNQAYQIVNRYNDSVTRFPWILIMPDADPDNLYPLVLGFDISTRVNVELGQSPNLAGIDKDYHIEGIEHNLQVGGLWETKYQLWDVNLFRIFEAAHTGYLYKNNTAPDTYDDCHDAANADSATDDDTVIAVGQANDFGGADDFKIWRGYLEFDTSDIEDTATIAMAEIIMEVDSFFVIDNEFNLTVVSPGSGVENPLAIGDYNTMMGQTTSWGSVTIVEPATNKKVLVITLNATGISAISKTGITRFGLRSSRDISSTTPGTGVNAQEYITIDTVAFAPRLAVKLNEAF